MTWRPLRTARKPYCDPEFELIKFRFGAVLEGGDDVGFRNQVVSDPQDYAEEHGAGPDE